LVEELEIAIRASVRFAVRELPSGVLWIEMGVCFRVRSIGLRIFAQIRSPESRIVCARESSLFGLEIDEQPMIDARIAAHCAS